MKYRCTFYSGQADKLPVVSMFQVHGCYNADCKVGLIYLKAGMFIDKDKF